MTFDSRAFRNALGQFATGVCVITTQPKGFKPFGMTVNSFSSVSLDPPLVLWSLQNNSECYEAFQVADKFCVNILSADQKDISGLYAKKGDHDLDESHYRIGRSGNPVLRGALASFECTMWNRYDGGDHIILVGKVEEFSTNPNAKPLAFYAGQYRELR
jgi:flavin reductase (DIM6/NTAB) family NADH-FMN oxidoreductase RutF